jgi:hypothetical protein
VRPIDDGGRQIRQRCVRVLLLQHTEIREAQRSVAGSAIIKAVKRQQQMHGACAARTQSAAINTYR